MGKDKSVFIPYILQSNIEKYYFARNRDMSFAKAFVAGLYPSESKEREKKFCVMAENLLIYDTCYINFDDFLYLCEKVDVDIIIELMRTDVIRLIDTQQLTMSCVFGMNKSEYVSLFTNSPVRDYEQDIRTSLHFEKENNIKQLLYLSETKLAKINTDMFVEQILNESYNDLENSLIRRRLNIDEMTGTEMKLGAYNNFKLNRIFFLNYSLQMASSLGLRNVFNESIVSDLLNVKLGGYINSNLSEPSANFVKILEFEGLENVNKYVEQGVISFRDILKMRESKNCIRFRQWIHERSTNGIITSQDKKDVTSIYNEACKESKHFYNNKFVKALRIGIPEIVGAFDTTGTIISKALQGADFALNKLINGWKPSLFIDAEFREYIETRMNEQKIKDENQQLIRIYGSIARNDKCPCGSTTKYKKCHGRYL